MVSSSPLLFCLSSEPGKENVNRKKKNVKNLHQLRLNLKLWSGNFLSKNQTIPFDTLVNKEIMISHIKIKNPWKFRSDNSRAKNDMKIHFSDLSWNLNLIYWLWKWNNPKYIFSLRVYFVKHLNNKKN